MTRRLRYILLGLMTVLTAACLLMFPRIVINDDMTQYLPDDSRMKNGVDSLKAFFPEIDMNSYFIKVMFDEVCDRDSLGAVLSGYDGIAGITSVEQKDSLVMYQLSVEEDADTKSVAAAIKAAFGTSAVVEHNANSIMPDNMALILIAGLALVFGILFLMCSSFVEALLFILTIGMAVVLNIGTNALLPSVSMLTNTIVAVLQFVLSMDYSIILMNRFRQVRGTENDLDTAMGKALKAASPSILSSGLTTIAGLLALVFMKFKIGMDLGIVLAKGVLFSLISIYTILPAFILIFHKSIKKTEKRVFLPPTNRLAEFELKARIPVAIVFLSVFGLSWYLSSRTELSYASIWESRINDEFTPKNNFSLLYRTDCEDGVIALEDSLNTDGKVVMTLDYPSIFKREMTAGQMCANIRNLLSAMSGMPGAAAMTGMPGAAFSFDRKMLSEDMLRFLYYAASHPVRDERMSFNDMIQLSEEASASGLLPDGIDVEAIVAEFMAPREDSATDGKGTVVETAFSSPATEPTLGTVADSVVVARQKGVAEPEPEAQKRSEPAVNQDIRGKSLRDIAKPDVDESGEDPYSLKGKYHFTKEELHTQMNSAQMAEYLGFSNSQASAAYSMAKKRKGTMTPDEFINYMIDKVLGSRLLRTFISGKQAEGLHYIRQEMDAVLAAEDAPAVAPEPAEPVTEVTLEPAEPAVPVTEVTPEPAEKATEATPKLAQESATVPVALATTVASELVGPADPSPLDQLAEMFASGEKYSALQIYRALHRANIDILDEGTVNLMFTYYGSKHGQDDDLRMNLDSLIDFLSNEVASNDDYAFFIDDSTRGVLSGLRAMVDEGTTMLRKDNWSMAAIVTEYPIESEETFSFVERTLSCCDNLLGSENCCLIGESVMYKEMKDGFRRELVFLTLLTIFSIFLIVALTFRSVLIPVILVMTVITGVNMNVFFSGIGGSTMLYLAYLIVQSILMGATIDYGILFTNYYLWFSSEGISKADALKNAYRCSIHTIMTSGLILVAAPLIMSVLLTDPTIRSILSCLSYGALTAIFLIIFVLPAVLASCDRLLKSSAAKSRHS